MKKKRSAELSFELGYRVWVYSCTNCPVETHSGMECKAPPLQTGAEFENRPYQKPSPPAEIPPWGNAIPGTEEHYRLLAEWVVEKQQKKGWDRVKVYVEAQIAGWHLEAYPDMDEDVKQALIDRGLLPSLEADNTTQEAPMRGAQDTQSPPESSIALDDIIKAMQENQE